MPATLTINLAKAIGSVMILGNSAKPASPQTLAGANEGYLESDPAQSPSRELEAQKAAFSQVSQMLKEIAAKLKAFLDEAFAAHKEDIAKLSVEIARKILAQKVEDGDYEIESIVKEALNNAPVRQDVVVHLNPKDLSQYHKLQQAPGAGGGDEPNADLVGVKFVPDANIGPAECLLETPKGIIESMIDQHLEQVGKALNKVG
ncbi:MAG: hypothetical protein ISS79_00850 [Phycisphaerae bacterium]|nr:hypothetical protein [Phycisphaerae bacterium]